MSHDYPNIILFAIPFFAILMALEFYVSYKGKKDFFEVKDSFSSIFMGIGSIVVDIFTKLIYLSIFVFLYQFRFFDLGTSWWVWLLLLLLHDLLFYWKHRLNHEIRFLWASHSIHHSSEKYNLSTALRQEWVGRYFGVFFFLITPFLGFHPLMLLLINSVSLIYQYWIHTQTIDKLPAWFEYIFNTPSHHRVHHATNTIYLDKNHGGIFIVWDRMFGTFQKELKEEKAIYGLTENINSFHIFDIASFEWLKLWSDVTQKNISLKNRFLYLLKPPGWKHDGKGITTKTLQKN